MFLFQIEALEAKTLLTQIKSNQEEMEIIMLSLDGLERRFRRHLRSE